MRIGTRRIVRILNKSEMDDTRGGGTIWEEERCIGVKPGGCNWWKWKERNAGVWGRRERGTRRHLTCLSTRQSGLRARSSADSTSGYSTSILERWFVRLTLYRDLFRLPAIFAQIVEVRAVNIRKTLLRVTIYFNGSCLLIAPSSNVCVTVSNRSLRLVLVWTRSPLNRAVASGVRRIRWQRLHSEFEMRASALRMCCLRVNCTHLEILIISCYYFNCLSCYVNREWWIKLKLISEEIEI